MDFSTLEALRSSHPAWRLLRAENGPLIASFLHRVFLKTNVRRMAEEELARQLDDDLFRLRRELGSERFPKAAKAYLSDWADDKGDRSSREAMTIPTATDAMAMRTA